MNDEYVSKIGNKRIRMIPQTGVVVDHQRDLSISIETPTDLRTRGSAKTVQTLYLKLQGGKEVKVSQKEFDVDARSGNTLTLVNLTTKKKSLIGFVYNHNLGAWQEDGNAIEGVASSGFEFWVIILASLTVTIIAILLYPSVWAFLCFPAFTVAFVILYKRWREEQLKAFRNSPEVRKMKSDVESQTPALA